MKKELLQVLFLIGLSCLFFTFTGCNSGSKNQTNEEVAFNQETFDKQIQGVYKYGAPYQGISTIFDNHFIFVFGDSDTTMFCQGGTYTASGDTVTYTTKYSSNPEFIGTTITWTADFMGEDSIKVTIFDDNAKGEIKDNLRDEGGTILSELYNIRIAKVDEQAVSQMMEWEGVYTYTPPRKAMGIVFGGYILYGGQIGSGASGTAATYEHKNDTVTVKRLYTLDPNKKGTGFRWINESINGDTLNWATINNADEIMSRGKSVYIK